MMLKPRASPVLTGAEALEPCCLNGGLQSRVATDEREENLSDPDYVEESVFYSHKERITQLDTTAFIYNTLSCVYISRNFMQLRNKAKTFFNAPQVTK